MGTAVNPLVGKKVYLDDNGNPIAAPTGKVYLDDQGNPKKMTGAEFAASPERTPFYREELERQRAGEQSAGPEMGTLADVEARGSLGRKALSMLPGVGVPSPFNLPTGRELRSLVPAIKQGAKDVFEFGKTVVTEPFKEPFRATLTRQLLVDPTAEAAAEAKRISERPDLDLPTRIGESIRAGAKGVPIVGPLMGMIAEGIDPGIEARERGQVSDPVGVGARLGTQIAATEGLVRGVPPVVKSAFGARPVLRTAYGVRSGRDIRKPPELAERALGELTERTGKQVGELDKLAGAPFGELESRLSQPIANIADLQNRLLQIQGELNIPASSMPKVKTLQTGEWVVEVPTGDIANPLFQVEAKSSMNFAELREFKNEVYRASQRATPKGKAALARFADAIETENIRPAVTGLGDIQLKSGELKPATDVYEAAKKGYSEFAGRFGRDSAVQEFLDAKGDPAKQVSLLRDPSKGKAIKESLTSQFGEDAVREWNTINAEGLLEPQLPGRPVFGQMTGMSQKEAALARLEAMAELSHPSVPAEARLGMFSAGRAMLLAGLPLRIKGLRKWMVEGLPDVKPAAKLGKVAPPEIAPLPPPPSAPMRAGPSPERRVPDVRPSTPEEVAASIAADKARNAPKVEADVPPVPQAPSGPSRLEQSRTESIRRTQIGQVAAALEKGREIKGRLAQIAKDVVEKEVGIEAAKQMTDVELASALRAKLKPSTSVPVPPVVPPSPSGSLPKPPRVTLKAKESKLPKPEAKIETRAPKGKLVRPVAPKVEAELPKPPSAPDSAALAGEVISKKKSLEQATREIQEPARQEFIRRAEAFKLQSPHTGEIPKGTRVRASVGSDSFVGEVDSLVVPAKGKPYYRVFDSSSGTAIPRAVEPQNIKVVAQKGKK